MNLYNKEQLNELQSKIDIFEFYQKYLPNISQRGRLAWVCCPFHNETKSSFSVDLNTGIWKCWGENIYGSIFSFYQKYFNISFKQAVEEIADIYNYTLEMSEEDLEQYNYTKKLYAINTKMSEAFQKALHGNNEAYNYLVNIRGFSPKIIEDFKLGCGISRIPIKQELISLALLKQSNDSDEYYATFGNYRVVIPRIDENGHILSFTGRMYKDVGKDLPKYLHARDTEIYKKSEFVFGLYNAKKYIKHFNKVILVEGELDCIKCHQKLITNTVAISGLNMSDTHINKLKKYTNNFYICLEDEAMLRENTVVDNNGKKHNITPLDKIYFKIKENIPYAKVYVVDLRNPDGTKCDPDEYLNSHSKEDFNNLVKEAKIYNEFIINSKIRNINPKNIEEKTACLNSVIPFLVQIPDFITRKQYIELVSNKLAIPENDIYKKVKWYNERLEKVESSKIHYDKRPVFAQKILLSTCFCDKFSNKKAVLLVKYYALNFMEPFYANMFKEYIAPYVLQNCDENGKVNFKDFFNELMYTKSEDNSEEDNLIKKTLTDCYLKVENLEDLEQEDLEDLIQEQIDTLSEWTVPNENTGIELLDI